MALNIVNTEVVPLEKGLDLIHKASFSPSESPVYVTSLALRLVNSLLHWDMCINIIDHDFIEFKVDCLRTTGTYLHSHMCVQLYEKNKKITGSQAIFNIFCNLPFCVAIYRKPIEIYTRKLTLCRHVPGMEQCI